MNSLKEFLALVGKVFNQEVNISTDINGLGRKVILKLLQCNKEKNERRLVVDMKHMSLTAREEEIVRFNPLVYKKLQPFF